MASGDKFLLKIEYDCQGVQCFNILHYEAGAGGDGDAAQLVQAFVEDLRDPIRACMHNTTSIVGVEAVNLDDPTDDLVAAVGLAGTGNTTPGGEMPTFVTAVVEKTSPTRAIRSGAMRVPGIPEGFVTGNGFSAAGLTPMNALAAALPVINSTGTGGSQFDLQIYTRPNATYPSGNYTEVTSCRAKDVSYQQTRKT